MIGTKLAHYAITTHLGSGGMGDVYLATDTKLGRSVAIKVLPAAFASDSDRLSRFRREAQVLASLNHPNIAQVYGIEESSGTTCIAMELVKGETLQTVLARGPLKLDEALPIAMQIATALETAHERGIVHRDLKPGNVMLTSDGQVKVLDFGLARSDNANPSNPTLSNSPTIVSMATNPGIILGTAAYMSPEQARGKVVDKRTDIWAFGMLLHEMLTGKPLFQGSDLTETLAAVVMKEPDLTTVPIRIRRLLKKCLEKDPKNRLRDIGDVRLLLDQEQQTHESSPARRRLFTAVSVAVVGVAAIFGWMRPRPEQTTSTPEVSLSIGPHAGTLDQRGELTGTPFISPDGSAVIFYDQNLDRKSSRVQLRLLNATEVQQVRAIRIRNPGFWSNDSKTFFFGSDTLLKIRVPDGAAEQVASGMPGLMLGGSVSDNGTILFAAVINGVRLYTVAASQKEIRSAEFPVQGCSVLWPEFLPGSEDFLVFCQTLSDERSVYMATLRDGKPDSPTLLMNNDTAAHFTPAGGGQILFVRDDNLYAQRLNRTARKLEGEPQLIERDVSSSPGFMLAHFSVSRTGVIAWRSGKAGLSQVTMLDRKGIAVGSAGPPTSIQTLRLSPDESHLLAAYSGKAWLLEPNKPGSFQLERGSLVTVFSPDGSRLLTLTLTGMFSGDPSGIRVIEIPADGSNTARDVLALPSEFVRIYDVSPDGKTLLMTRGAFDTAMFSVSLEGSKAEPRKLVDTGEAIINGSFAPDGRWILYQASGKNGMGIYVQPFPGPGLRREIASNGGYPVWRKDGREIVFIADHDGRPHIWSVTVNPTGQELRPSAPAPLFPVRLPAATFGDLNFLAVSRDGSRFYIPQAIEQPPPDLIHIRTGGLKGQ